MTPTHPCPTCGSEVRGSFAEFLKMRGQQGDSWGDAQRDLREAAEARANRAEVTLERIREWAEKRANADREWLASQQTFARQVLALLDEGKRCPTCGSDDPRCVDAAHPVEGDVRRYVWMPEGEGQPHWHCPDPWHEASEGAASSSAPASDAAGEPGHGSLADSGEAVTLWKPRDLDGKPYGPWLVGGEYMRDYPDTALVRTFASEELSDYEIANLREGLLVLRSLGLDTGDWLQSLLNRYPQAEHPPNAELATQVSRVQARFATPPAPSGEGELRARIEAERDWLRERATELRQWAKAIGGGKYPSGIDAIGRARGFDEAADRLDAALASPSTTEQEETNDE